jgi:hypothetical protein
MGHRFELKRNDGCLCGSGKKYKHCCEGTIDFNQIIRDGDDWQTHLSIRGKNLLFFENICEALGFDSETGPGSLKKYKSAFTPQAVKKIHESILDIWPTDIDINKVLSSIKNDVSGLYIGDYDTEYIIKGLIRHSIYANKLIVVDPFVYPLSVRDEFNPILHPDQYQTQTLKNVNFWLKIIPWIQAGVLEVIRTPADFSHKLQWDSLKKQTIKFKENEELRKALEQTTKEFLARHKEKEAFRDLVLSAPNSSLLNTYRELNFMKEGISEQQFIKYIEKLRENDPNFLKPFGTEKNGAELHMWTTGSSYDMAKLTSNITGSYLVTDIYSKWKEIEIDHSNHNDENTVWAPFAKAFQNIELKYLNNINLDHALKLRKDGRIESLRVFLRKVWKSACHSEEPFSEINAKLLADELVEEIRKAEHEWKEIDRNLLKWFGAELSTGLLAAGPLISSGHGHFLAAALATAGAANLLDSTTKRKSFQGNYPAAFFMNLKKD